MRKGGGLLLLLLVSVSTSVCLHDDTIGAAEQERTELLPQERDAFKGNDPDGKSEGNRRSEKRFRRDLILLDDYYPDYSRSPCTMPAKWCYEEGCHAEYCKCIYWTPGSPYVCRDRNSG